MTISKRLLKQLNFILFGMATLILSLAPIKNAKADSFSVSPMFQNVSLIPGETYYGTFKVTNPSSNSSSFSYRLSIQPFSHSEANEAVFENNGDYNQIVNWINLEWDEGVIEPNSTAEIRFSIDVPSNAPAGGQYAAIMVSSAENNSISGAVNLDTKYQISHLIYADVAGETARRGDISDVEVPGFLFSGKITGSSKISNLGNVHSRANQTLQIFPLFSEEEVYTNEENPDSVFIMPESSRLSSISWDSTPSIGIFHVIYNVEFEGVNQKVDKMVIVCPLWLLFIIAVVIFLIVFKILNGKKENK
ncbi:hypothetical protein IJH66_01220 [Candidatus Saccharibacteria bacterium]|nr:hypothetical protein [Candidatus Saccharibacteria bacterium]